MSDEAVIVRGTRRGMRELVDGTIRVQIDIDPPFRQAFLEQFSAIDTPVALAPLVMDRPAAEPEKPTPEHTRASLCLLAVEWCRSPLFQGWVRDCGRRPPERGADPETMEEWAANYVREVCDIGSRKELDLNMKAAAAFHRYVREPYREWLEHREAART